MATFDSWRCKQSVIDGQQEGEKCLPGNPVHYPSLLDYILNPTQNSVAQYSLFVDCFLCFASPRYKQMIKMSDYLSCISIWLFHDWLRNTRLTDWHQGRDPFTVYVYAIFNGVMFGEGQGKTMANHLQCRVNKRETS